MIIYKAENFTYELKRFQFGMHGGPFVDATKIEKHGENQYSNSSLEFKHILIALKGEQLFVDKSKEHSVMFKDINEEDLLLLRGFIAAIFGGEVKYYG